MSRYKGQVAINRTKFEAGHCRGQVATEFFAYSSIFLLVVIITASSIYFVQDTERAYYENRFLIETGQRFATAHNLAVSAGQGFSYKMTFSKSIMGYPYNVSFVTEKSVVIEWDGPHGAMVYAYVISPFDLEFGGCIDSSFPDRGILFSDVGDNELTFQNDGSKVLIYQGGVCP